MLACRNGGSWRSKFKLNLTHTSPQVIQSCKIMTCMPDDFVDDYILDKNNIKTDENLYKDSVLNNEKPLYE